MLFCFLEPFYDEKPNELPSFSLDKFYQVNENREQTDVHQRPSHLLFDLGYCLLSTKRKENQ